MSNNRNTPDDLGLLLNDYRVWLEQIDDAFDGVRRDHPDVIPCCGGCWQCCYALFAVPAIDGFLIWEGLRQSSPDELQRILALCETIFDDFKISVCGDAKIPYRVERDGWKTFEKMAEAFQRPCPFLTCEGWCGVYKWRPRICRLAGTVFTDPVTRIDLPDFCPTAAEARLSMGFRSAPMDLLGMDLAMMEFREKFRAHFEGCLPRGHTFPLAGVLEARNWSSKHPV